MLNLKNIYKINPAILGGLCGGFTGLILYVIYNIITV